MDSPGIDAGSGLKQSKSYSHRANHRFSRHRCRERIETLLLLHSKQQPTFSRHRCRERIETKYADLFDFDVLGF